MTKNEKRGVVIVLVSMTVCFVVLLMLLSRVIETNEIQRVSQETASVIAATNAFPSTPPMSATPKPPLQTLFAPTYSAATTTIKASS